MASLRASYASTRLECININDSHAHAYTPSDDTQIIYDPDDVVLRDSSPLKPMRPNHSPSPLPISPLPQVSPESSPSRKASNRSRNRPNQGNAVLVSFVNGKRPDISRRSRMSPLASASPEPALAALVADALKLVAHETESAQETLSHGAQGDTVLSGGKHHISSSSAASSSSWSSISIASSGQRGSLTSPARALMKAGKFVGARWRCKIPRKQVSSTFPLFYNREYFLISFNAYPLQREVSSL